MQKISLRAIIFGCNRRFCLYVVGGRNSEQSLVWPSVQNYRCMFCRTAIAGRLGRGSCLVIEDVVGGLVLFLSPTRFENKNKFRSRLATTTVKDKNKTKTYNCFQHFCGASKTRRPCVGNTTPCTPQDET